MPSRHVIPHDPRAEAERRAAILKRYVAIERASAADDEAFAAELGLRVPMLIRLASTWRRHANVDLLLGRSRALATHGSADLSAVMATDIDLSGVLPGRRAEALRRIRIIQRHLKAEASGGADVDAAAREVGMTRTSFQIMVQAWRLHARAEDLPGFIRRRAPWRKNQPVRNRRLAMLREVAEQAGPTAKVESIHERFLERCRDEGIEGLSLPRVYVLVRKIREATSEAQGTPGSL